MKLSSTLLVATCVLMVKGGTDSSSTTAGPTTYPGETAYSQGGCFLCGFKLVPAVVQCITDFGIKKETLICIKDAALEQGLKSCIPCVCEIVKKISKPLGTLCCQLSGCGKSGDDSDLYLLGLSVAGTSAFGGFTNCPKSLTYGGGSQLYRFVEDVNSLPPPTQILPCHGDIDNCIYTAHKKYYCMNGDKPDYTPHELHPHWDNVTYTDPSTFAGTFFDSQSVGGNNFKNFSTCTINNDPILSIKLFPNIYATRSIVLGGFIFKSYPVRTPIPADNKPGWTNPLPNSLIEPTYIYLKPGESITEAHVRYGWVINQLTFGITTNYVNPVEPPRFQSAGGHGGGAFDATPPPNLNGHCALQCLKGQFQTSQTNPEQTYINALEFIWSCVGKPSHYVH